jgi:hypothetical protein
MSGSFFVVGYIVYHCPPSTLLMEGTGIYLNLLYPHIKSINSGTAKVKIFKKESDPPLFTSKQLI